MAAQTAIAEFDRIPYQTVTGSFELGVRARHIRGVDSVEFYLDGSGSAFATVSSQSAQTSGDTGTVYRDDGFRTTIDTSEWDDGEHYIDATIVPTDEGDDERTIRFYLYTDNDESLYTATYYLNASTGDDDNDGLSSGAPVLTLDKAISLAAAASPAGNTLNGGETFVFADGDYEFATTSAITQNSPTTNRWVTFTGGTGAKFTTGTYPGCWKNRIKITGGMKVQPEAGNGITFSASGSPALWFNDGEGIGTGDDVAFLPWGTEATGGIFFTNWHSEALQYGYYKCSVVWNCTSDDCGEDALKFVKSTFAFTATNITNSISGGHPDVWQWFSLTAETPIEDGIVDGLTAVTGIDAQGVGPSNTLNTWLRDITITNLVGAPLQNLQVGGTATHLIIEDSTYVSGGTNGFRVDCTATDCLVEDVSATPPIAQPFSGVTFNNTPGTGYTMPTTAYPSHVLADEPAMYLRLEELNTGDAVADASGNGNAGANVDTVTVNQDGALADESKCFQYAATGHTLVSDSASLESSGDFTVEAWVKFTGTGVGTICCKESTTSAGSYGLRCGSGKFTVLFEFGSGNLRSQVSTTEWNDGNWHHVVGLYHATDQKLRIYVDGELDGESDALGASRVPDDVGDVWIGRGWNGSSYTNLFAGHIDEVAIYTTALSPARIADHYAAGLIAVPDGVTATADGSTITVTWNDGEGETSYDVQYDTDSGFASPTTVNSIAADSETYDITGLAAGTYYVRVRGVNANGNGDWSTSDSDEVTASAPEWSAGTIAADGETLTLTWTRAGGWPEDMTGYNTAACTVTVSGSGRTILATTGALADVDGETLSVERTLASVVYAGEMCTVEVEAGQAYSEANSETIRTEAVPAGTSLTNSSEVPIPVSPTALLVLDVL